MILFFSCFNIIFDYFVVYGFDNMYLQLVFGKFLYAQRGESCGECHWLREYALCGNPTSMIQFFDYSEFPSLKVG